MDAYKQLLQKIEQLVPDTDFLELSPESTLGAVLQQDVNSDLDMPSFHKSAVDGFACRAEDLELELVINESIPAGEMPSLPVAPGTCTRIMTGAPVPEGADTVFMIEDAVVKDKRVRCTNPNSKRNICYLGEDFRKGDTLLKKGVILQPQHLPVLAGAGLKNVLVAKKPGIALLVTGSELVDYPEKPEGGKIRNTNGIQLMAALEKMHMPAEYLGMCPDDETLLKERFLRAASENRIVILTGGAAVGDFDLVPKILKDTGYTIQWDRTGLKPGNPMSFAIKGRSYVFGLSGNPVSSFVQFEYLVKPVLYRLMGAGYRPFTITATMAGHYFRKNASRMGVVPVRLNSEGMVEELPFNGSAHIHALALADAFLEIPAGIKELKKGEKVNVRPI